MSGQVNRLRRQRLAVAAAAVFASAVPLSDAGAQTATIRIVVPLPAGGGVDVVARQLAEQIGQTQGVTFIIENRPGAGRRQRGNQGGDGGRRKTFTQTVHVSLNSAARRA